jgi:hypothetical protein
LVAACGRRRRSSSSSKWGGRRRRSSSNFFVRASFTRPPRTLGLVLCLALPITAARQGDDSAQLD